MLSFDSSEGVTVATASATATKRNWKLTSRCLKRAGLVIRETRRLSADEDAGSPGLSPLGLGEFSATESNGTTRCVSQGYQPSSAGDPTVALTPDPPRVVIKPLLVCLAVGMCVLRKAPGGHMFFLP